jgi:hypothetical protein
VRRKAIPKPKRAKTNIFKKINFLLRDIDFPVSVNFLMIKTSVISSEEFLFS